MSVQTITNPMGYDVPVSDFRTGLDDNGGALAYGQTLARFRANATITAGQSLVFVAPTQTVPLSVTPGLTANADGLLFAGVATRNASAGDYAEVVVDGYAFAQVAGTISAGDALIIDDAGKLEAHTIAATTVVGSVCAVALAANASGDATIPVLVKHL